jgi:hypothetical protein
MHRVAWVTATVTCLLGLLLAGPAAGTPATASVAPAAKITPTRMGVAYGDTLTWMSDADLARALDDAVALHVQWVRADLSWADIQPDSSRQYLWSRFDRVVAAARARGLRVLPVIGYTPAWARDRGCGSFVCPPRRTADFTRFVARAVHRYSPAGVHAWEVWNEENSPIFWPRPNARRYAHLLRATTITIRRHDWPATVLMGGLAATDSTHGWIDPRIFLGRVCRFGGCRGLTGVAYHPYTFPFLASDTSSHSTSWNRIDRTRLSLRSVLAAHGYPRKKIWVTEYGAPTGGPGTASDGSPGSVGPTTDHVTEQRQAQIAADAVSAATRSPEVAALFWYTDRDDPNYTSNVAWFGLRRPDGSAKPAWQSFADAVAAAAGR